MLHDRSVRFNTLNHTRSSVGFVARQAKILGTPDDSLGECGTKGCPRGCSIIEAGSSRLGVCPSISALGRGDLIVVSQTARVASPVPCGFCSRGDVFGAAG